MIDSSLGENIRLVNTSLSSNIIMPSGETNSVSVYDLIKNDLGMLRISAQDEVFNQI